MMRALIVAVVCAGALTLAGRLGLRTWPRGAILASATIMALTQGRDVATIGQNIASSLPPWQTVLLCGLIALATAAAIYVARATLRRPHIAARGSRFLNLAAAVLVAMALVGALPRGSFGWGDLGQGGGLTGIDRSSVQRQGPDIYVILLDGYPRADTLAESYGFDNSAFLEELQARGFLVDTESHSNYLMTELSLTSFFSMSQLQDLPELQGVIQGGVSPQPTARRVLNDNPVFAELRARGYAVVSNTIPYEGPALRQADVFVDLGGLNEFERGLIASSFLLDLADLVDEDAVRDDMRGQIGRAIAEIPVIAADRDLGPRMVFAHVLAPHGPFLFDAAGNPTTSGLPHRHEDWVAPGDLTEAEFRKLLIGEIQFINRAVLDAIDGILDAYSEPPIVIVMSDHGVRARPMEPDAVTATQLRDAFGSLFAALTPGRTTLFPNGTSPSQVMARLLDAYFNAGISIPSGEAFISTGSAPYSFIPAPPLGP